MPPSLPQHLRLWAGLYLFYVPWWIATSPVTCLEFWKGFHLLPRGAFVEVYHYFAPHQPQSEFYTRLHPCSSPTYGTWQFRWSCLTVNYYCPEWCHWISLSVLHGNLGGLKPLVTPPQIWIMTRWGQQVPSTNQPPFSMEILCRTILLYTMPVLMHINLPYFMGLWPNFPQLVILTCLFYYSNFTPSGCPPPCIPQ